MAAGQKIHEFVETLTPQLIAWRRDFHKYPESGWTEFRTASLAARKLMQLGFTVVMGRDAVVAEDRMGLPPAEELARHELRAVSQGGDEELIKMMHGGFTAFWADMVCGSGQGPTIAIRFDMDANDCSESTAAEHLPTAAGFVSENPVVMHACAHDGHTAIGLGVAEVIAKFKDDLNGTVRLMFQPAEEGVRGAYPMVTKGVTKGVDVVLGIHIGVSAKTLSSLVCGISGFLATTKMDVDFTGKSAHAGSHPHEGKNALMAACAAATNLHGIARHGGGDTRITVGKLIAGQGRNVVPPNARLETRGETTEINEFMESEALRIIKGAAEMWGCTYAVTKMGAAASAPSDPEVAAMLAETGREMGCYDTIVLDETLAGSDDFTYMLEAVQKAGGKGTYALLGSPLKAPHHNDRFDFEETVLSRGVELVSRMIWKVLG